MNDRPAFSVGADAHIGPHRARSDRADVGIGPYERIGAGAKMSGKTGNCWLFSKRIFEKCLQFYIRCAIIAPLLGRKYVREAVKPLFLNVISDF